MALTKPQGNMLMKAATQQATTSGTAIDFTGIPAGTMMIVVSGTGVSTNGTSFIKVQLGISSGIDSTADYRTRVVYGITAANPSFSVVDTSGFIVQTFGNIDNTTYWSAILTLKNPATNEWAINSNGGGTGTTPYYSMGAGTKALSGVLDRVRITSANPDTFDAGSVNIAYF